MKRSLTCTNKCHYKLMQNISMCNDRNWCHSYKCHCLNQHALRSALDNCHGVGQQCNPCFTAIIERFASDLWRRRTHAVTQLPPSRHARRAIRQRSRLLLAAAPWSLPPGVRSAGHAHYFLTASLSLSLAIWVGNAMFVVANYEPYSLSVTAYSARRKSCSLSPETLN